MSDKVNTCANSLALKEQYKDIMSDWSDRRHTTQIADDLGVSRSTLYKWQREPGFMSEVHDKIRRATDGEMKWIYYGLVKRCKEGDVAAIKLLLQLRGELVENATYQRIEQSTIIIKGVENEKQG
jgi:hypothetical protein